MFPLDSKFLVVDDTVTARQLVRDGLMALGYKNIDGAEDGEKALDMILKAQNAKKPYTLVFSDVNMPKMNGLELLEKIRGETAIKKTPVIIITTDSSKAVVLRAVVHGISGYMVKPFSVEEVKKKVEEIYQRIKLEHSSAV